MLVKMEEWHRDRHCRRLRRSRGKHLDQNRSAG